MKAIDLTRKYTVLNHGKPTEVDVTLGETIWWFPEGQTNCVPMVAFVTRLGDGGQLSLRYFPPQGTIFKEHTGVVAIGDDRLKNANVRKKGAWCTRAFWSEIQIDK